MDQILEFISRQYEELKILMLLIGIFLGSFLGALTIYFASLNDYKFLRDKNHLLLGLILPPIGFIIVYVIGSNLALSLGMIGALSIIRFRTPVRSSYELTVYFLLLTIGIALKVNFLISMLLTFFSISCFALFYLLPANFQSKIFDKKLDENITVLLEFKFSTEKEKEILSQKNLISLSKNQDNLLSVNLAFDSKNNLENFLNQNKNDILSYEIYKS